MKNWIFVSISSFVFGLIGISLISVGVGAVLWLIHIPGEGGLIFLPLVSYSMMVLLPVLFLIAVFKATKSWKLTIWSFCIIAILMLFTAQKNYRKAEKLVQSNNDKVRELMKQNNPSITPSK